MFKKKKGKEMSTTQDLPPPNGFPNTIRYSRYLPKRGPSGLVILSSTVAIVGYGWSQLIPALQEKRELERENAWSRIYLVPLLQAETDRDTVRRLDACKEREGEIMKARPDWSPMDLKAPIKELGNQPVYHTSNYVAPVFYFLPNEESRIPSQWWRGWKMTMKNPTYHDRPDFTAENPIGV